MNDGNGSKDVIIEIPQIEKAVWSHVWKKMRGGETLQGKEIYIGRSMADHPNWFPFSKHSMYWAVMIRCLMEPIPLSISIFIRSWVKYSTDNPKRHKFLPHAYQEGDCPHTTVHLLIAIFQIELKQMARRLADNERAEFDGRLTFKGYVLWADYPLKRCGQNSGLAHHHNSTIFTAHQRIN